MSTRSIIMITGTPLYNGSVETIRLYKHSDGYPTGNLPIIRDALARALKQVTEANSRFKDSNPMRPSQVAALIIGEAASVYGSGADLESKSYAPINKSNLGNQCDLEWIYVIDLNSFAVNIYSGDQAEVLAGKTTKPESYVTCLYEECQADELKETKQLVEDIKALGFSVNKKLKLVKGA